ncbi:hypothetical protein ECTOK1_P11560 (plasmid) [Escherichia coli]|nr:hypothetical protein ECTOK1_P11560 [Escherichia coli]
MESLLDQADRDLRGVRSLCDAVFFLMKKLIKLFVQRFLHTTSKTVIHDKP